MENIIISNITRYKRNKIYLKKNKRNIIIINEKKKIYCNNIFNDVNYILVIVFKIFLIIFALMMLDLYRHKCFL
ncbi:hypothetical protein PFBG_03761 [Plasmodium falciparum 7G8]|uniref:Uncharacterized protein n=4 Tax=Plasmodium falciparum TaxID=5833 RepID=A0A024W5W0_PLAFA|nr:hypothetical protein PFTANZ_03699 [Plasmodium falciparum Tanzania (2000708)]ETW41710.1 hypothetical protein PFNF135_03864 [Plasmodium falciparum NF135/5.C10]ETW60357.1 hypothetical protein PFMC_03638 [Plasmodium falciparum CAMP/Malaysia]EUR69207.1 hypothetical protein PFBG_03761 [Plasmodium falciparum 7G8]